MHNSRDLCTFFTLQNISSGFKNLHRPRRNQRDNEREDKSQPIPSFNVPALITKIYAAKRRQISFRIFIFFTEPFYFFFFYFCYTPRLSSQLYTLSLFLSYSSAVYWENTICAQWMSKAVDLYFCHLSQFLELIITPKEKSTPLNHGPLREISYFSATHKPMKKCHKRTLRK